MSERSSQMDPRQAGVRMRWGVKIPLRDGIHLNATLYTPIAQESPSPVIFTLTPYIGQTYHDRGLYFAAHGYPFLAVDVRGRGNSEGVFDPNINEGRDGYDIVEWLAKQPYCNGRVAMWGGSYAGADQWTTAANCPPHLVSIVPVASPFIGVDFPIRNNIPTTYLMQWLTLVSGRASQDKLFFDSQSFWNQSFQRWFEYGASFKELDSFVGNPSEVFQRWIGHPYQDRYWDAYNPRSEQYARLSIPILTITGCYDVDQLGALTHYREHLRNASDENRARHYLVIGPWDHAGTRTPQAEFGGLTCGPASLVDLGKIHVEWYAWVMRDGPKPDFLKKNVAYYVMGADRWRYADSLEEITSRTEPLYLQSIGNPIDVFQSGSLGSESRAQISPDVYIYDPRDVSHAPLESTLDPQSKVDQRLLYALTGRQLIYHSQSFDRDTEVSGFFKLSVWIAIDQPDTDFRASIYEIGLDGSSVLLSQDWMRARHRESLRHEILIRTSEPLRYDFSNFTFISRQVRKGSRLRLVIGPINSIHFQKNYNSGGEVAEESLKDARPVTVRLFHDQRYPSVLYVPFGRADA